MHEISPRPIKDVSPWHIQRRGEAQEAEYAYEPQAQSFDLRHYWNVLVKHRRLVVGLFLAVFLVVGLVNISSTPLYTSSAMLQIEPQNPAVTGLAEILSSKSEGSAQYDYYQTQFTLLRSRALAARVITSLQLASDPVFRTPTFRDAIIGRVMSWAFYPFESVLSLVTRIFSPSMPPMESVQARTKASGPVVAPHLISRYFRYLQVTPVKNTRLVEVIFNTPDPRLSQKLADAHAAGFIRMNLDNRSALTDEAREFLDKKNAELRAKLERSEEALNRFRQTHGVVSLDKGENIVVDRLVALNSQLTTARAQRIDAESLFRTVANKKYQDLSQIMTQGSIPQLKSNIATLEAEYARLATIFKPDHPRLQELNDHVTAARRNLNSEVANIVRGIESSYVASRAREQALEAEAKKQEQQALDLKHIGVQYAVLQEDVNVNRSLYESVLKRLSETSVSNDLSISNMQITQRADLPMFPSSPQTARNLILGAVVGLFLGIGMAFLLDYLDTKMSTPEHVERAVSLNTLGVVPDLNGLDRVQIEWNRPDHYLLKALKGLSPLLPVARNSPPNELLLTKHHPQSIFPESYRSIRTSILFSRAERPPQVILLTSAAPGEGKTSTSLNLAIALAQDGHSVLVIDADLRKGRCHNVLGMTNHKGLSNILTGNLVLEEGIQPTPIKGLSLLSCGVCPPSPADLLGSNKMREILTRLRASFEFILIDSPPAIALSDAAVLSVMADGVVLVFHGRKTTTASARQLIERLDAVRAPVLGVVLNSVDLQNPNYSYYDHYKTYYSSGDHENLGKDKISNGLVNLVHQLKTRGESAQFESVDERQRANDFTADLSGKENIAEPSQSDPQTTSTLPRVNEIDREVPLEPVGTGTAAVSEPTLEFNRRADLLPPESLDRLIAAVTKSIGPIAPLLVRDQIANLGESYSAFPKRRIGELVTLLQREITERTTTASASNPVRQSES
jgi:succinoglycan biosynthesis transport protein ExoP